MAMEREKENCNSPGNMPVTHAGLFHVIYLLLDGKFQSLTVAEFITVTSYTTKNK